MFLDSQMSCLVENFNIGIFSDTINMVNVKLCMMVPLLKLYLSILLSVTWTIYQGRSNVEQFRLKICCSYLIKFKLCRIVK